MAAAEAMVASAIFSLTYVLPACFRAFIQFCVSVSDDYDADDYLSASLSRPSRLRHLPAPPALLFPFREP